MDPIADQVATLSIASGTNYPTVHPLNLENDVRPPTNLYTPAAPYTVNIISVERISGPDSPDEIFHVVFHHDGFFPCWEGQVFGVMPTNPENAFEPGDATKLRTLICASTRYGDSFDGLTASVCVRRDVNDATKESLCFAEPGDKFQVVGPTIRVASLLGNYSPTAYHIFVAFETGVAPFRAHIRRFFFENNPKFTFSGCVWLLHGASHPDNLVYQEEFMQCMEKNPKNFTYSTTLTNDEQYFGKVAETAFDLLCEARAYIYIVGPQSMLTSIEEALRYVAEERGLIWEQILDELKRNNQWRVLVSLDDTQYSYNNVSRSSNQLAAVKGPSAVSKRKNFSKDLSSESSHQLVTVQHSKPIEKPGKRVLGTADGTHVSYRKSSHQVVAVEGPSAVFKTKKFFKDLSSEPSHQLVTVQHSKPIEKSEQGVYVEADGTRVSYSISSRIEVGKGSISQSHTSSTFKSTYDMSN